MIVWLARHGAAIGTGEVAIGWSDPPLSPTGREQAEALASSLAPRRVRAVHTSDLRRARETAECVAARHAVTATVTSDLRELNFGAWEGRRLSALWTELPDEAQAWEADIRSTPSQFGESVRDLERRVRRFRDALFAQGLTEVVVVAHHGSLAALEATLTGAEFAAAWSESRSPGSVRMVDVPC